MREKPLVCESCGLRCWNDESVRWLGTSDSTRQPFCVENGCAAQEQRRLNGENR